MGTKKIIGFVATTILTLPIFANGASAPISLEMRQKYNQVLHGYYPNFIITSLKNNVVISKITINKGNCKFIDREINIKTLAFEKFLPKKLNEYQQANFDGGTGCNVKIVDMTINNTEWSFSF